MKKVLVTGADGRRGTIPGLQVPVGTRVPGASPSCLDVRDRQSVSGYLLNHWPDAMFSAVAYAAVDYAEGVSELAILVNADGPANLAMAARKHNILMLQNSTVFVCDGRQGAPYQPGGDTKPPDVYGRSKRDCERKVMEIPDLKAGVVHDFTGVNLAPAC